MTRPTLVDAHPCTDGPVGTLFNASARAAAGALLAVAALGAASVPAAAEADPGAPVRLLVLGDSLVAGYGLPPEHGFIARLEEALEAEGWPVIVLDGGVSGDTSAGALARLDWALADEPDAVLLEIGANDALRGIDPASTRANIAAILERLDSEQVPVLLAGMMAPRNLGAAYTEPFDRLYPELAADYETLFYPFFLEGVAMDPRLNLADGIHPNAAGVAVIVDRILPSVVELLGTASPEMQEWSSGGSDEPISK